MKDGAVAGKVSEQLAPDLIFPGSTLGLRVAGRFGAKDLALISYKRYRAFPEVQDSSFSSVK